MRTLKDSCGGLEAPKGWRFQDCEDEFVSLLRTSKKGDWTVDFESFGASLEDAYVSAEKYEKHNGIPAFWDITAYDPYEGHSGGNKQYKRDAAIKELICLAKAQDIWDSGRLDEASKALWECRKKFGIHK